MHLAPLSPHHQPKQKRMQTFGKMDQVACCQEVVPSGPRTAPSLQPPNDRLQTNRPTVFVPMEWSSEGAARRALTGGPMRDQLTPAIHENPE